MPPGVYRSASDDSDEGDNNAPEDEASAGRTQDGSQRPERPSFFSNDEDLSPLWSLRIHAPKVSIVAKPRQPALM